MKPHYDLFVIGAGSGGISAARVAAGHGAKVGMAEVDRVGGTCVNRGCIPKKLYVYAAQYAEELRNARGFGWTVAGAALDWNHLKQQVFGEVERLDGVYRSLLRRLGVTLHQGRAELVDRGTVQLDDQQITADRVLIATGSHPYVPELEGADLGITSDEAFHLPELPQRIAIIGGGYIATEFASIFNGLGVECTLLTRGHDLLRGFDDDVRCQLHLALQSKGVRIRCNTRVVRARRSGDGILLHCDEGQEHATDLLLFATGRRPNSADLGLEELGVELGRRGAVEVDEWQQTSVPGVFAVGDVTDRYKLTPVAIAEGRCFAESQFGGRRRSMDYLNIPTAVFSAPPVASVGLTETAAREFFRQVDIYRTRFRPLKHSLGPIDDMTMMKLVVDRKTDRVLGVHMVGSDAAEIVQGFAVALRAGATKTDIDRTVGIHPTSAEEFVTLRQPADPGAIPELRR